jgi:hypothetical protein
MRTIHLAILACLMTLSGLHNAQAEKWTVYGNARFGTFADYPAERFAALPPPEDGDGQIFQAHDGATLTISGSYNIDNDTPASYETSLRQGTRSDDTSVTYRATGKDWLALSGIRGNNVFYEKYLFRGDIIHAMVLTYPRSLETAYRGAHRAVPARPQGPCRRQMLFWMQTKIAPREEEQLRHETHSPGNGSWAWSYPLTSPTRCFRTGSRPFRRCFGPRVQAASRLERRSI